MSHTTFAFSNNIDILDLNGKLALTHSEEFLQGVTKKYIESLIYKRAAENGSQVGGFDWYTEELKNGERYWMMSFVEYLAVECEDVHEAQGYDLTQYLYFDGGVFQYQRYYVEPKGRKVTL